MMDPRRPYILTFSQGYVDYRDFPGIEPNPRQIKIRPEALLKPNDIGVKINRLI
jgi:hypothetical protein